MGTIKISYKVLESEIGKLSDERSRWDEYASTVKPTLSGGGMAVTIADEIADAYSALYSAVCTLGDNTIAFMENIKNSVQEADDNAAATIQ